MFNLNDLMPQSFLNSWQFMNKSNKVKKKNSAPKPPVDHDPDWVKDKKKEPFFNPYMPERVSGSSNTKVGDSGIARSDNLNVDPNYEYTPTRKPKTRKTLLGGFQNSLLSPFGLNSAPSVRKSRLVGK